MKRLLTAMLLILAVLSGQTINKAETPKYPNTPAKDFEADAPWRVASLDEKIPFAVIVKDADTDGCYLEEVKIEMQKNGSWQTVHLKSFGSSFWNDKDNWTYLWRGKSARELGLTAGSDVYFRTTLKFDEGWYWPGGKFAKTLKIRIAGTGFPKAAGWFYGDTHVHSGFTDNLYEFGAGVGVLARGAKAMGLDWLTITDHSCDFDAAGKKFLAQRDSIAKYNTADFKMIQGEEVTVDFNNDDNSPDDKIHYLVYQQNFVRGPENPLAQTADTSDRLTSLASALAQTAVCGYAAHPFDNTENFFTQISIGNLRGWQDNHFIQALANPAFKGFELYNERDFYSKKVDDYDMNPFPFNQNSSDNRAAHQNTLYTGISKWQQLLNGNLQPLRKIFISGGSDAHGDMNYVTSQGITKIEANDNALGKARTAVYCPAGINPVEALTNGNSIITDGPFAAFHIDFNGNNLPENSDAVIGNQKNITLNQIYGGSVKFNLNFINTAEFGGNIQSLKLYINDKQLELLGRFGLTSSLNGTVNLPLHEVLTTAGFTPQNGQTFFMRLEAKAADYFVCFTNPVWLTVTNAKETTAQATDILLESSPNPFNPTTTINFSLPGDETVELSVYNAQGALVKSLIKGELKAGSHQTQFNATNLPSGVYYSRLQVGNQPAMVKRMLLLK